MTFALKVIKNTVIKVGRTWVPRLQKASTHDLRSTGLGTSWPFVPLYFFLYDRGFKPALWIRV